jgi:chromosome partitioning protein
MHATETQTVAVSTQKGGAGKTTVAINTAGALADRGRLTALIDLDPQGHATEGLGLEDAYDADGATLRDALTGDMSLTFSDIAVEASADDLAVIPAHAAMAARPRLEPTLETDAGATEQATRRLVDLIEASPAETVIIDCPPSLGALTDVGLLAAGQMLIPAKASGTSMRALELLLSKKRALEQEFDVETIQPAGVIANEVRRSGVSDNLLEWLEETFGDAVPVWQLRQRVALERAWVAGASIYQHDEDCPHAVTVFDAIADHLEAHNE